MVFPSFFNICRRHPTYNSFGARGDTAISSPVHPRVFARCCRNFIFIIGCWQQWQRSNEGGGVEVHAYKWSLQFDLQWFYGLASKIHDDHTTYHPDLAILLSMPYKKPIFQEFGNIDFSSPKRTRAIPQRIYFLKGDLYLFISFVGFAIWPSGILEFLYSPPSWA